MSQKTHTDHARDALDQAIGDALRRARSPRGVPGPQAGDPPDEELLRVVDGSATADERRRVDEAAERSAWTRDRLAILRDALAESGHGPGALGRAARYVFVMAQDALELLRGSTAPVHAPGLAWATRGGATAGQQCFFEFTQPFKDLDAHLKIEHVTRANAAPSIDVQIKLVAEGAPAAGARVTLMRDGRTVDSVPVESNGAATFAGLGQDRYEIEVRRAGKTVGRVHLDFLGQ